MTCRQRSEGEGSACPGPRRIARVLLDRGAHLQLLSVTKVDSICPFPRLPLVLTKH